MSTADTPVTAPGPAAAAPADPSSLLLTVVAFATGALAANLYYAQPLIARIAPEIGVRPEIAGSVVSVTQIGYALGLFFLVSLADLLESKRLVMIAIGVVTLALVGAALSGNAPLFFAASLLVGLSSTGAQVLVPFASQLVPPERRGRVVGNVMAGLLTGILLARPASLFISAAFGWRSVFLISAVLMLVIGALLFRLMPRHQPRGGVTYPQILASMWDIIRDTPVLRRRAAYQALLFAAFNIFWTAAPLMLADRFGLNQTGIALFALAGAGGALAAPIAGRLADRGLSRATTFGSMAVLAACFFATGWATAAGLLFVLVVMAVLIDAAVQGNQIVSQHIIFTLRPELRGRLNAIYMTCSFIGGAIGSLLATASYHWGGWTAASIAGGMMGVIALALFATERRAPR